MSLKTILIYIIILSTLNPIICGVSSDVPPAVRHEYRHCHIQLFSGAVILVTVYSETIDSGTLISVLLPFENSIWYFLYFIILKPFHISKLQAGIIGSFRLLCLTKFSGQCSYYISHKIRTRINRIDNIKV
jgi:hypothetical protein